MSSLNSVNKIVEDNAGKIFCVLIVAVIKQSLVADVFRVVMDDFTGFLEDNVWKIIGAFMLVVIAQAGYIQLLRRPVKDERAEVASKEEHRTPDKVLEKLEKLEGVPGLLKEISDRIGRPEVSILFAQVHVDAHAC